MNNDPLPPEPELFFDRKEVLYLPNSLPPSPTSNRTPPLSLFRGGQMDWYLVYFMYSICVWCKEEIGSTSWDWYTFLCTPEIQWRCISKMGGRGRDIFFLSFYTAILKPHILFEPVFQYAKFRSWFRNIGDAISRSEKYRTILLLDSYGIWSSCTFPSK